MSHAASAAEDRQSKLQIVSNQRFDECPVELRQILIQGGYDTLEARLDLFDLDYMDAQEMALNTRMRKQLEKFLGMRSGYLLAPCSAPPNAVDDTSMGASASQTPGETDACRTPCAGRGGRNVSNFPTTRDKDWEPSGTKMGPDTTRFGVALQKYFEPRYRECLTDVRQMTKTQGGESLADLFVSCLVFENADEEGAEFIIDGKQKQGIINCTISRLLGRQEKVCCHIRFCSA